MPRPSPISIRLPQDLLDQIEAVAANRNGFIREAVKEKLAGTKPSPASVPASMPEAAMTFDRRVQQLTAQGLTTPVARKLATTEGLSQ